MWCFSGFVCVCSACGFVVVCCVCCAEVHNETTTTQRDVHALKTFPVRWTHWRRLEDTRRKGRREGRGAGRGVEHVHDNDDEHVTTPHHASPHSTSPATTTTQPTHHTQTIQHQARPSHTNPPTLEIAVSRRHTCLHANTLITDLIKIAVRFRAHSSTQFISLRFPLGTPRSLAHMSVTLERHRSLSSLSVMAFVRLATPTPEKFGVVSSVFEKCNRVMCGGNINVRTSNVYNYVIGFCMVNDLCFCVVNKKSTYRRTMK